MILGTGPTQQNPVDFTPPNPGGGNIPKLPHTGFYSGNIWPFSQVMHRMSAFPAYRPNNFQPNNYGLQPLPPIAPPPVAAAPAAPAPGTTPAGTAGAFGGSGFGSSGGVRAHGHIDPYTVMRQGMIPGVSPSGSNIRNGYMNAGARVEASMPFQSHPLAPSALPAAPAPMPTNTHGGLGFSWNPVHWFSRPRPRMASTVAAQNPHMRGFGAAQRKAYSKMGCEVVGPRLDGTYVTICNGRVVMVEDSVGNVRYAPNAY